MAQQAVTHKSERVLQQAVARAEKAAAEARTAERQAAEAAAHSSAHQEVASSQAQASQQVGPHPPGTLKQTLLMQRYNPRLTAQTSKGNRDTH